MVDNVKLNAGDNKSQVAYDMARDIWFRSDTDLNYENRKEFLDLVQECVQALQSGMRRAKPSQ